MFVRLVDFAKLTRYLREKVNETCEFMEKLNSVGRWISKNQNKRMKDITRLILLVLLSLPLPLALSIGGGFGLLGGLGRTVRLE